MHRYKCFQYHWKHIGKKRFLFWTVPDIKQGIHNQYFLDRDVLNTMLKYWATSEWVYWESPEDAKVNMNAVPTRLPYLKGGFWGNANHHHEFNTVQPHYSL